MANGTTRMAQATKQYPKFGEKKSVMAIPTKKKK